MDDLPPGMLQEGRSVDPDFAEDERLYRRVRPKAWFEPPLEMELDVVDAVNMSVNRSKYGPPEWVRLGENSDWGVIFIAVGRLPSERHHHGSTFSIHPQHVPHKRNYPHSEIWVHHPGGNRVLKEEELDPVFSMAWREFLLRIAKIALRPTTREG